MWVEVLATAAMMFVGFMVWLKSKLPSMDNKTAELIKHLNMYDIEDDTTRDEKEKQALRCEKYMELAENYYNLTTGTISKSMRWVMFFFL